MKRSEIVGVGAFLPKQCVTNVDLPSHLETSDAWIRERTGIEQRYIAENGETCALLGARAAQAALDNAQLLASDIDMIIVGTSTADHPFPATGTRIQEILGAKKAFAMDVQAACSGFIYALSVGDNFIRAGQAKTVLVIGAEVMSRLLDWTDRTTCVLFGDGAGAAVLRVTPMQNESQILSTHLFSDGSLYDSLYVAVDDKTKGQGRGVVKMNGREIFKHAVNKMVHAVETALTKNNLTVSDIDWFVPHQANARIIDGVCEKCHLQPEKVVYTVQKHANTSAASIPLALAEAANDGRIQRGHLVLIESLGAGLTWASALIRW